ncbi:ATP-binding protein [Streptomyces kanamyceticus]|uniref:ATP-binding protein n=1 Tax=Streptomyces kanamyceticus TaxID=1967 RepID=A0A5J6GR41_STRKN|nr:ATP-binding protein [Streptomyces kanamyceticus]
MSPDRSSQLSESVPPRCAETKVEQHAYQIAFLPDPIRVPEMRKTTAAFLRRSEVSGPVVEDAVLAVSELVTNAIRHGDGMVCLFVSVGSGGLRVSVTDQSPEQAEAKQADIGDLSGRGLLLVAALADNWGSSGEETWCTFRYPLELEDDGVRAE